MPESAAPRIRQKTIAAPEGWPHFGWGKESTKEHFVANPPQVGDTVILLNTHGGMYLYQLVRVEAVTKQQRLIVSRAGWSGGTSFHRSGLNAFMPKGQTTLMPLVPALAAELALDCDVQLDVGLYASPKA